MTAADIASTCGVSPPTVYDWLRGSGVKLPSERNRRTQETRSRIARLLDQQMSPHEIADELGIAFTGVYRHMRIMGVRAQVDRRRRSSGRQERP
jgi:IS30 family transposase